MKSRLYKGFAAVMVVCIAAAGVQAENSITIGVGGADVKDNDGFYKEQNWRSGDLAGGIENLTLTGEGYSLTDFRAIVDEGDYGMNLKIMLSETATLSIEAQNFRKYFSDTGGYFTDWDPSSYRLGRELALDIGSILIELELADDDSAWTTVLGYQLSYKDGVKSTLERNSIRVGRDRKYIYPATQEIEEMTHVVSIDVKYDDDEILVEDRLSYEIYDSDTYRSDLVPASIAGTQEDQGHPVRDDDHRSKTLANDIRMEKWLSDDTLLSAGYLLVKSEGEAVFAMAYTPANGAFSRYAKFYETVDNDMDQISHVFNVGLLNIPSEDLAVTLGIQAELSENEVEARNNLKHGDPASASFEHLVDVDTSIDALILSENIEIRYTGMEGATWYANAKLVQDMNELEELVTDDDGAQELRRKTEAVNLNSRVRVGLTASPSSRLSWGGYYQYRNIDNDYDHKVDEDAEEGFEAIGYSGNIKALEGDTHEVVAKLDYRISGGIRTGLKYQYITTEGDQTSVVEGGTAKQKNYEYEANIVTLSATIVPSAKTYCTAVVQYRETESKIPELSDVDTISPHTADSLSVIGSLTRMVSDETDLSLSYLLTVADNEQNPDGLPVVAKFARHSLTATVDHELSDTLSCKLAYAADVYNDDNYSQNEADYTAHGLYASVKKVF